MICWETRVKKLKRYNIHYKWWEREPANTVVMCPRCYWKGLFNCCWRPTNKKLDFL